MENLTRIERFLLLGHIASMGFGLAGLLLVLPHPQFIAQLPPIGQTAFAWSMAGGGVVYMLLGFAAVTLYALRQLGTLATLGFLIPALSVSVSAELIGTSTGFPFGYYRYLSGLGYKIAGLVPFTIPLSWFYLGFCAYVLVRTGLRRSKLSEMWQGILAIAIGATLLMSWDFVLDPAMSQTTMPFWVWDVPGAFFGMPYQNFAGWFGTGAVFMTLAALIWRTQETQLPDEKPILPLAIYLSNFAFATVMSIGAQIYPPILLGLVLGVFPAIYFYHQANAGETPRDIAVSRLQAVVEKDQTDLAAAK